MACGSTVLCAVLTAQLKTILRRFFIIARIVQLGLLDQVLSDVS